MNKYRLGESDDVKRLEILLENVQIVYSVSIDEFL